MNTRFVAAEPAAKMFVGVVFNGKTTAMAPSTARRF
jgi:hypothetical protein